MKVINTNEERYMDQIQAAFKDVFDNYCLADSINDCLRKLWHWSPEEGAFIEIREPKLPSLEEGE